MSSYEKASISGRQDAFVNCLRQVAVIDQKHAIDHTTVRLS